MSKAVRKNAKWHLVDIPVDMVLYPDLPRRQRALRGRRCNRCGVPITAGEEHLAVFFKTDTFFMMRHNLCCICGLEQLQMNLKDVSHLYAYISDQLKAIKRYIKDRNLELKRDVHKHI
jgi:hypothetical protein